VVQEANFTTIFCFFKHLASSTSSRQMMNPCHLTEVDQLGSQLRVFSLEALYVLHSDNSTSLAE
jgi:hypothetical protein